MDAAVNWATLDDVSRSGAVMGWIFGQWSRHPLAVLLLVIAGDTALVILYAFGPRAPIFGEDRGIEMATALLFLAAFVFGLLSMRRPGQRDYPVLLPAVAGLGLLGFLDEISFGARLFGWSMPQMVEGGEFDGAHDLVILAYRLVSQADPMLVVAAGGSASTIALGCVMVWRRELQKLAWRLFADPTYSAMALFIAGVSVASLLDLELGMLRRLGPLEEIAELNAALALLVTVMGASSRRVLHATRTEGRPSASSINHV
jgi:hypothetical protein